MHTNYPAPDTSPTIVEMLDLREQGLSNPQIAERLGVPYSHVLKRIGKQPRYGTTVEAAFSDALRRGVEDTIPSIENGFSNLWNEARTNASDPPLLTESLVFLEGSQASYEITYGSSMTICRDGKLPFSKTELIAFVQELEHVIRRMT